MDREQGKVGGDRTRSRNGSFQQKKGRVQDHKGRRLPVVPVFKIWTVCSIACKQEAFGDF